MVQIKKNPTTDKVIRILLAIFAAIIFWIYVNGSSIDLVSQDIQSVPVTITNLDVLESKGLTIEDQRNYYVNLRLKGTERNLEAMDESEIVAVVDLKDINEAGTYTPDIVIQGMSNSVILDQIKPEKLSITVDDFTEKEFDVSVNTSGKPAGDDVVIQATTNEKVTVNGGTDLLAQIKTISATADVQGLMDDTRQYVGVKAYDANGDEISDLEFSPRAIPVDIVIGKTKTITISPPQTTGDVATGYKVSGVTVSPATALIGGKQDVIDTMATITPENVDVTGATATVSKDVTIQLPDGVYFIDGSDKVTVNVAVEELTEKSFTVDNIETKNLASGLSVSRVQDSSVVVKVQGTTTELNKIKSNEITAWVDLTGKIKGKSDVPIQVKLPAGTLMSISPEKTAITLE